MSAELAAAISVTAALSYAVGSIPWAYIIVALVAGEDVTQHGTGNVGAMNVRRSTGSWVWFAVAMVADASKGFFPVLVAKLVAGGASLAYVVEPASTAISYPDLLIVQAAIAGAVLGHNYSMWLALKKHHFGRTGKGLATGGGALLAYDWRYFVAVLIIGLAVIAITRYMMAGQVAAAVTLPVVALATGSSDWAFMAVMGAVVYAAHHRRFIGLLHGKEPKLYIEDRMGPQG